MPEEAVMEVQEKVQDEVQAEQESTMDYKVKRRDMNIVHPSMILVDHKFNGRVKAHDDESVQKLADSIAEHGQQQPVVIRPLNGHPDYKFQLVSGYRRHAAVSLLNKSRNNKDQAFLLCVKSSVNEDEAFIANLIENIERKNTTVIDDVHNMRRLKEEKGYTNNDLAKLYGKTSARISQLYKLLELDDETQMLVHDGKLKVSHAIRLTEIPPKERKNALKDALKEGGEGFDGEKLTEKVSKARAERGQNTNRTMKQAKDYFFAMSEKEGDVGTLCEKILGFLNGTSTERQLTLTINKIVNKDNQNDDIKED